MVHGIVVDSQWIAARTVLLLQQRAARRGEDNVFLGTVVACLLLVVGTVWWSHRVQDELAHDRETVLMLAVALNHLPEMVSFRGKPYVRVVADKKQPVIRLLRRDGTSLPGHYAQVWRATPQRH